MQDHKKEKDDETIVEPDQGSSECVLLLPPVLPPLPSLDPGTKKLTELSL